MSPEFQRIWDSEVAIGADGTIAASQRRRLHEFSKSSALDPFLRDLLILARIGSIPGVMTGARMEGLQRGLHYTLMNLNP